jgi:hypothetical protein
MVLVWFRKGGDKTLLGAGFGVSRATAYRYLAEGIEVLTTRGGFSVLTFERDEPPLGYIETLAGELFLESAKEIGRLNSVYDHLRTLAMSPAESIKMIKERANGT